MEPPQADRAYALGNEFRYAAAADLNGAVLARPATTMVVVQALARPNFLIEVEATAVKD